MFFPWPASTKQVGDCILSYVEPIVIPYKSNRCHQVFHNSVAFLCLKLNPALQTQGWQTAELCS